MHVDKIMTSFTNLCSHGSIFDISALFSDFIILPAFLTFGSTKERKSFDVLVENEIQEVEMIEL